MEIPASAAPEDAGTVPDKPSLFVSDSPLREEAAFSFAPIIRTLREFIASAPLDAPLNICVSGAWGTGKTTLLRGLERVVDEGGENAGPEGTPETSYVTIWFDPWKLSSEQEVRNALARAVLEVIERDADFLTRADISIDRKNVLRMLSDRLLRINPDEVSTVYRAESSTRETFVEVESIFRRVADVYLSDPDHPRRLVIFIDDLDRCRPARITEVLEAVKLFFDLPGLIFVFALDRVQLEKSVAADYGFTPGEARVYLEKIFQLTVPLPRKRAADLRTFLESTLQEIGVEVDNENLSTAIVDRFGRNLRNLKLFINSFSFQRKLIGEIGDIDEEALFRWQYLEATMDRSMTAALRDGSPNLVLALEFVAHGGFLHDEEVRNRYISQLRTSTLNYAVLVAYSIVSQQDGTEGPPARLSAEQQGIVDALQADGALASTLKVIREGKKLLIDVDLPRMIYLTRSEDVGDLVASDGSSAKSESEELGVLSWGSPLTAKEWSSMGEAFKEAKGARGDSYLCYLMAALMDNSTSTYKANLGRMLRVMKRYDAAKMLFSQVYEQFPISTYLLVEMAYLYDVDLLDEESGSLLYRKAIMHGTSTSSVPYNLSWNLNEAERYEDAYLACLEACVLEPENDKKQSRLVRYARDAGYSDRAIRRPVEDLKSELQAAKEAGKYPLTLSEEEEEIVNGLLTSKPDLEQAKAQLSRPPL